MNSALTLRLSEILSLMKLTMVAFGSPFSDILGNIAMRS